MIRLTIVFLVWLASTAHAIDKSLANEETGTGAPTKLCEPVNGGN